MKMQGFNRWMTMAAIPATALLLAGCGDSSHDAEHHKIHPATVEPIADSGISRITLTDRAAERLGIQLAEVSRQGDRLVAPYGALLYDASGGEWVYVSPQSMVFKRTRVEVDRIKGDQLYLQTGPEPGTKVVTVGAPELFGAEFEIGH